MISQEVWKQRAERRTGLKMQPINKEVGYEEGNKYYNTYWDQIHTIKEIRNSDVWDKIYISEWQDGHITGHCTEPDYQRDFLVLEN